MMKKIAVLLLALALSMTAALADLPPVETEELTVNELLALRRQIDAALTKKMQEVDHSANSLDGLLYASNGTEVRINGYEGTDPNLVIPSEIDGCPVTMLHKEAFKGNNTLVSVVIPEGIEVLPKELFSGCWNLEQVSIPSSVHTIETWVFRDTYDLKSLVLPEDLITLDDCALAMMEGLEGVVVLPESLTELGRAMFLYTDKLKGVVIQGDILVGDDTFDSDSMEFIYVKDGCVVAFDGKLNNSEYSIFGSGLKTAILPASVYYISDKAFDKSSHVTIVTPPGSYAEAYAKEHWLMCNTKDYDQIAAEYEAAYLK